MKEPIRQAAMQESKAADNQGTSMKAIENIHKCFVWIKCEIVRIQKRESKNNVV